MNEFKKTLFILIRSKINLFLIVLLIIIPSLSILYNFSNFVTLSSFDLDINKVLITSEFNISFYDNFQKNLFINSYIFIPFVFSLYKKKTTNIDIINQKSGLGGYLQKLGALVIYIFIISTLSFLIITLFKLNRYNEINEYYELYINFDYAYILKNYLNLLIIQIAISVIFLYVTSFSNNAIMYLMFWILLISYFDINILILTSIMMITIKELYVRNKKS